MFPVGESIEEGVLGGCGSGSCHSKTALLSLRPGDLGNTLTVLWGLTSALCCRVRNEPCLVGERQAR